MKTIKIGIRYAKTNFSKLLLNIQHGSEFVITDRGKPVGKLISIPKQSLSLDEWLTELERQGLVQLSNKNQPLAIPSPIPISQEISQKFLNEDRGA